MEKTKGTAETFTKADPFERIRKESELLDRLRNNELISVEEQCEYASNGSSFDLKRKLAMNPSLRNDAAKILINSDMEGVVTQVAYNEHLSSYVYAMVTDKAVEKGWLSVFEALRHNPKANPVFTARMRELKKEHPR